MKRAALVSLLACTACSLTQSLDHLSYSEGQGGASSGGTGSAATSGTTTTGAGASSVSASASSAGGNGPGAGGQGGAGQGGGAPFCVEGQHAFCVDFEQGLGDWSYETVSEDTALELSTERSTSPTHALRSSIPGRGDDDLAFYATVTKDFDMPWTLMTIDFELFVEVADWKPPDVNAGFFVFSCPAIDAFGSEISVGGAMSIGADYVSWAFSHLDEVDGLTLPPFPFGEWTHVHLELDPRGFLRGSLGDQRFEQSWPQPSEPDAARCTIHLGISGYNDPVPDLVSFVDDVTVDLER